MRESGTPRQRLPEGSRLSGILLMCGGVACFALCDASAKWLNATLDPMMTAWARYAFNVAIVSIFLNPITVPGLARSNRLGLQILRSAILVGCTVLNFLALQHLQLTQSMAIQFAMPLLVALLAGPFLGEWAGPRRMAAIGIGFLGVLVVTRPLSGALHPAAFLTVGSTILYAFYAIVTRTLAAHDRTATTVFYSGLVGVVIMTPVLPFVWSNPPGPLHWGLMVGVGIFAAAGHGLLVMAHARAPAPVLSPFIYTQLLWMALLGYVVFGDVPDGWTLLGAAIVIGSGLYLLWWERRSRRVAARP
ncbi:DMT family transporter [Enterovirga aerilata]|uniref:DMT family transporter n=1 Tax=Enterovirga aerilata TaxID=2730920 RepID=A0A849I8F8_9HYPH|nr:DMT family transporter [Enterovirga sp. DB1703]NNM73611.1 DMT family transporter [Enterovirga sp. DB1703]